MASLRSLALGLGAAVLVSAGSSAQAAMIDDFSHGTFGLLLTPFSDTKTTTQTIAAVAGGSRFVEIGFTPGGRFGLILAGQLPINGGQLYFQNILHTGGSLALRYGDGATLDLLEDGDASLSSLHVVVDRISRHGSAQLTTTIKDTAGHSASSMTTVAEAGDYAFPFANFTGVNLNSVDTLKIKLRALSDSADVTLGSIRTDIVPEPSGLALLGVTAAGLVGCRRRRKQG